MGSKLLVLDLLDHLKNSNYSNLCDKYNDFFEEFKGISAQYDIKHHIDLVELYKSPPKPC